MKGDTNTVEMLLGRGTEINSRDSNGKTALHLATNYRYRNITLKLLENGIDIDDIERYAPDIVDDIERYALSTNDDIGRYDPDIVDDLSDDIKDIDMHHILLIILTYCTF